jgi:KilA-N domain
MRTELEPTVNYPPVTPGTQIHRDLLIQTITTGPNEERGTWAHPRVAIHCAMWCSAMFAVQVTSWVEDWYATRRNPLVADAFSPYHAMLNLIREVKGLLQELEMYKPRHNFRYVYG